MTPRLVLPRDYRSGVWKNGQGVSHDIAGDPADASWSEMVWRVAIAEIARDSDFSDLTGFDRTFMTMAGRGLILEPEGREAISVTSLHAPISFPGEWRIHCRLHDGPAKAFNVMTARAKARHRVRVATKNMPATSADILLVHALAGEIRAADRSVPEGATLVIEHATNLSVAPAHQAVAAIVEIDLGSKT